MEGALVAINLQKNKPIDLTKSDGGSLSLVRLGLGWDVKTETKRGLFGTRTISKKVDLDASAILFSGSTPVDVVYFGQLRSKDGSITHTGDNLSGEGEGDDESIMVELPSVPGSIDTIVFTVNSYTGDRFSDVENAYVRVVDSAQRDEELARYSLTGGAPSTALVMAKVTRSGGGWSITALGEYADGRTAHELQSIAARLV